MRLSVIELRVSFSLNCRVLLRWTCLHVLMFRGVIDSLPWDLVAPGPSDKLLKTSLEKPIKQRLVIRSLQAVPAPRCHRAITPACAHERKLHLISNDFMLLLFNNSWKLVFYSVMQRQGYFYDQNCRYFFFLNMQQKCFTDKLMTYFCCRAFIGHWSASVQNLRLFTDTVSERMTRDKGQTVLKSNISSFLSLVCLFLWHTSKPS